MSREIVSLSRRGDIAVVTIRNPPVNVISAAVRAGLREALTGLEGMGGVRAIVLTAEGSTFCSGADIGEFAGPPKEAEYRDLFRRLEQFRIPIVAALHGTVLGGGLELALACHYRIAAPGTRLGLPELTLGIIPGAGGTQRMPRLIGVEKTLELLFGGRPVDAAQALELGFVDQVSDGALAEAAADYARALADAGKGPRRTCDRAVDPASATPEIIERLKAKAKSQFPHRVAPFSAIEAVTASLTLPFEEGLLLEEQIANRSKATVEAKALIHVFFAERETRKIPGLQTGAPRPIRRAGIVGAGTMGGGIAISFANAGVPVTLLDVSEDAVARGRKSIADLYASMVKRGRISEQDRDKRLALISGATRYEALGDADVVVEAVFERMDLKRQVFAALDRAARPGAILATNTSTLDINEIAAATTRPADVVGLHFFAPAHVMPLLEVVRADGTSLETIGAAMDLAKLLRKTPVLARVCYGFIGNRMMEGYAREAQRMVLEGATPRQVDSALESFGMAMGILAVFDMAGIDVGVNVHRSNADKYPPDPTYYQADIALHAAGRLGQKSGSGYYKYVPGDRTRHDDPAALSILREHAARLGVPQKQHGEEEIIERCLYPLMNEGLRILEEGVALRASDIDVVWTSGYGFPRYRGGPMFHADTIGLKTLHEGMLRYRAQFGPMHWEPAPLLTRLVGEGRTLADWSREHVAQLR
ncbi:MAG TPA: 3-hydroxyacyl-CoA dehydrogenase NAD-binding domain-containing protein [Steroidobacteraceae bacterium]|nr:3-hydroxyacyl-CoA dehydrogenase NAD-binding domain-containing protein [Steroidobacteraceae bacterium]